MRQLLATMGPGIMVCFADTDGSCLLTAADSGAKWNYKLLLLQIVLIPTLYFAQELTVRLAIFKRRGLCGLLREEVGPRCAWAVAVPLLCSACLALISEISVVGQTVNVCWGVPMQVTNTIFTLFLLGLVLTGSFSLAEKVGLAMGCLQVFFFVTMFMAGPDAREMWSDLWKFPVNEPSYVKLVTANIGAVIMPWMLAYQQSAFCQKMTEEEEGEDLSGPDARKQHDDRVLLLERIDTLVGSLLTQGVMAAMLITLAATPQFSGVDITNVDQLLLVFTAVMGGKTRAKVLLTFAIVGACTVAAIVVSLCGAWALEEALGRPVSKRSAGFQQGLLRGVATNVRERPEFYIAYAGTCAVAWLLTIAAPAAAEVLTGTWTQFINGLLMPPIVLALWYLAAYKLDESRRLGPCLKWSLLVVFGTCAGFCIASIPPALHDAFAPASEAALVTTS
eukprot:TRINITY_DN14292_c0_g2_i1.p1 TRINITY_DN14292_c0_g2~~TRINITY_DN14292_c0_g2_i1.p1  ORF type:complete len:449 (+),score=119.93 TRINITY_DN14292_c0_g2_i1:238-1584(+)